MLPDSLCMDETLERRIWNGESAFKNSLEWSENRYPLLNYCFRVSKYWKAQKLLVHGIGRLHDGVILLLRPEYFSFFLSYLNLEIPARLK